MNDTVEKTTVYNLIKVLISSFNCNSQVEIYGGHGATLEVIENGRYYIVMTRTGIDRFPKVGKEE